MTAATLRAGFPVALALCAASVLAFAEGAFGQAIERNIPPAPTAQPETIVPPNVIPSDQNDAPLGPTLSGLVLLGASDPIKTSPVKGVDSASLARLNTPRARARLEAFIGRPVSRKLIAEIEAAIAREYRRAGFPFVSLSTPPQKIGGGVLQVRVIEFHAGEVTVNGASGRQVGFIRDRVRLRTGDAIDAPLLSDDLDWLNRYPFRHVEAVFSPGDVLGQTNLALNATEDKPWNAFAGYANSGSPSTGWTRYLAGAQVGGLLISDSLLSYQFTTSSDFWEKDGDVFGDSSHPRYLSHGLRLVVPTEAREEVEVTFDHVETNAQLDPFSVRQITDELTMGYRVALSNWSRLPGDVSAGVEDKREQRKSFFGGADVVDDTVAVYQLYAGWSDSWNDHLGKGNLNLTLHVSPGGISSENDSAALAVFSNGRINDATYAYINGQFSHYTRIGGQWAVSTTVIGQYAPRALPDTEQLGVGGQDLVRGFTLDDGSYDSAVIARDELRMPTIPLLARWTGLADQISPFVFLDAAYGTLRVIQRDISPVSAGAGADYQLTNHFTANLMGAYALDDGRDTKRGACRFLAQVRLVF